MPKMCGAVKTMFLVGTVIFGAFSVHVSAGEATIVEGTENVTTIVEGTGEPTKDSKIDPTSILIPTEEKLNATATVVPALRGSLETFKKPEEKTTVAEKIAKVLVADSRVKTLKLPNFIRTVISPEEPFIYNRLNPVRLPQTNSANAPVVVVYKTNPPATDVEPSFPVLDLNQTNSAADYISAHKILDGPIVVAVPLQTGTLATFFIQRGLRSIKQTLSLELVYDFLTKGPSKIGLTPSAAAALQLRPDFSSWPVQNIIFSSPISLSDIAVNITAHPTLLLVPESSLKPIPVGKDVYTVARFTMLNDLILFEESSRPKGENAPLHDELQTKE